MNIRYICKNCGSEPEYDNNSGQIRCKSCGSTDFEYIVDEKCPKCGSSLYYDEDKNLTYCKSCDYKSISGIQDVPEEDDKSINRTESLERIGVNSVRCNSCGSELIVEPNTASFKCPYCDSIINVYDNIVGTSKPDAIIPFKLDKKEAEEAFKKWSKKGFFLNSNFKYGDRIKEIKPMYIPFWVYDIDEIGTMSFNATKTRHYSRGDYDYTETYHYDCQRDLDLSFKRLPCDASEKMDDKKMDLLEPFNMNEAKKFNLGYLSGNLTEKYDYNDKQLLERAYKKARTYGLKFAEQDVRTSGFSTVTLRRDNTRMKNKNARYVLLPIWFVNYNHNGQDYPFMMNGQTGKVIGNPPVDYKKVFGMGSALGIISSLIFYLFLFVV